MRFSSKAVSAALAAAFGMAKFFGTLPCAFAAPLAAGSQADGQISASPISPLLASDFSPYALAFGLYRRVIEPVSMTVAATGLGVAATMGVKNLAEAHHRNRKAAQNFVEDGYKGEYERDKDKDTKRINHYEAHPSKNCYAVCGGQKTLSPADCSKKKFRSELSLYRRAIEYLFEDDDAWDENAVDADSAIDVDYAVEDALKKSPLSSERPLRPYQKKALERTNTTPKTYKGAPAKASTSSTTPAKAATPAKGAASSGKEAAAAPAKKSWNPFSKSSSSSSSAKDDSAGSSKKSSLLSSLNPFKSKAPNPDEVKHVKVGGGLLNKFRPAEKMRASAQRKVDAQVAAGGCAVVHNKINGQHAADHRFSSESVSAALAAPFGSTADGETSVSPISPQLASTSNFSPNALVSGLYRRVVSSSARRSPVLAWALPG
ncbi:hypothetical protein DFJ73DRAFT_785365 [Zopfochytrium polystomum]|nr:hypothetical protein DFJ73DRAFT_785365 [Zopfochytrium polystomum]